MTTSEITNRPIRTANTAKHTQATWKNKRDQTLTKELEKSFKSNSMGKRKERRLAALSNAGRRVKLDLFAEPSGTVFLFIILGFLFFRILHVSGRETSNTPAFSY